MGSQSRRSRKYDRTHKDPSHKVQQALLEEKRRKAREYKREYRACRRLSAAGGSSSTPDVTPSSPLQSSPLRSPSSLPVSPLHSPPRVATRVSSPMVERTPPSMDSTRHVHMGASSSFAPSETPSSPVASPLISPMSSLPVSPLPSPPGDVATRIASTMVERTPPTMESPRHVHMGSPSYAIGGMPHAHFSSTPSSFPTEGEHTPPSMGLLEHAHVEAPSSFAPGDPGMSSSSVHLPPDAPRQASTSSLRHLSRSGVRYRANKIASSFFGDIDVDSRRCLLDTLLRHPIIADARAAAQIWSPRSRRVGAAVIDSVRRSYTSLSHRSSRDALAARRTLTAAVSSSDMAGMFRATSRMLSIRRHTLRVGASRRQQLDLGRGEALWASSGRAPRCTRILDDSMRDFIAQFWEMHTRALPDFKKALRHRVGRKQYIEHGAHILEMTQHELFCLFRETHPEIVISERTFEACRPWFIRFMRERDTCCCRYHVEFQLLYDVFRRAPGFDGVLPSSPRDFVHTLLCEREEGAIYHQLACVEGTCLTCGHLERFPRCAADDDEDG